MFTKFFTGSLFALSTLVFASVGLTDKPKDCCSAGNWLAARTKVPVVRQRIDSDSAKKG